METSHPPYETLVLVCTNKRAGGERVSCAGEGRCGAALRDALKEAVAAKGLKGKVRVSASGCLDLCEEGPTVAVFSPAGQAWRKNVTLQDVPALMDGITKGM